jgi:histone-lysine N-methyltransferase EZH2
MQTAYTLHMDHQLPFDTIDETGVLPLKVSSAQGSVSDVARRR